MAAFLGRHYYPVCPLVSAAVMCEFIAYDMVTLKQVPAADMIRVSLIVFPIGCVVVSSPRFVFGQAKHGLRTAPSHKGDGESWSDGHEFQIRVKRGHVS